MTRNRATLSGFVAVLMWASLAVLTVASQPVPPLLLNAMCMATGGVAAMAWTLARGRGARLIGIPMRVHLFGILGLFGYHALFFAALRLAPPAEASLVNYLWPLLIVLFSGLLPGERLRPGHVAGAALGFAGAAAIIGGAPQGAGMGHALALGAAVTWAVYSVGSRRLGRVPTEAVAIWCLAAAILSLTGHMAVESTVWPIDAGGWLAVLALGLGPVGVSFLFWDIGMKQGDIQLLGALSYAAPLLSTLALVATGFAPATLPLAVGGALIVTGAALAARAGDRVASAPENRDVSSTTGG